MFIQQPNLSVEVAASTIMIILISPYYFFLLVCVCDLVCALVCALVCVCVHVTFECKAFLPPQPPWHPL